MIDHGPINLGPRVPLGIQRRRRSHRRLRWAALILALAAIALYLCA